MACIYREIFFGGRQRWWWLAKRGEILVFIFAFLRDVYWWLLITPSLPCICLFILVYIGFSLFLILYVLIYMYVSSFLIFVSFHIDWLRLSYKI